MPPRISKYASRPCRRNSRKPTGKSSAHKRRWPACRRRPKPRSRLRRTSNSLQPALPWRRPDCRERNSTPRYRPHFPVSNPTSQRTRRVLFPFRVSRSLRTPRNLRCSHPRRRVLRQADRAFPRMKRALWTGAISVLRSHQNRAARRFSGSQVRHPPSLRRNHRARRRIYRLRIRKSPLSFKGRGVRSPPSGKRGRLPVVATI